MINKKIPITIDNSVEFLMDELNKIPEYDVSFSGVGIVYVAGGNKYLTNCYASIRLLRDKGCSLPIQVFYLGDKERPPDDVMENLKYYNVEFLDARQINDRCPNKHDNLNGWEAKVWSIIHSKFQEVLYLDCDVFPDCNVIEGFQTEGYQEFGAYFFPDFSRMDKSRLWWKIHGLEHEDEPEFESGIIYVDKARCWRALNLTNIICEHGTRFYWNHQHGDKDCFRAGWKMLRQEYYMEQTPVGRLSGTMVQHLGGERKFFHRNMKKLHLITNEKVNGFPNEDKLFDYLEELKVIWNPYVLAGSVVPVDLTGNSYQYYRVGLDKRRIIFGKDGKIVSGAATAEQHWCVKEDRLHILDGNGNITLIAQAYDEGWVGRWLGYERCPVLLIRDNVF